MKTEIYDLGMNGEGIGKIDGKNVFVDFSLPNETVDVEILNDKPNYSIAKLNSILKPSLDRIVPACPYFYTCGGCQLQHLNYEKHAEFKRNLVKKTLKKILNLDFEVNNTITCLKPFEYRNKISFNFKDNKAGFYEENSKKIVEIKSCLLAKPEINKVYKLFVDYLKTKNFTLNVKNLVVRSINNQILVGVVLYKDENISDFYKILTTNFDNIGLYKIINNRKDSVVLSGKVIHISGLKSIEIVDYGIKYSVDLLAFHQTNEEMQNKIYDIVNQNINENEIVLNGFSGAGLLSAIIAKKAKQVYGIEIEKSSHFSAEKLKRDNHITNLININGDFYKNLNKIKEKIGCVVLDPSKKGCGKLAMQAILGVDKIIYVSCNPIALAKDLREILPNYTISTIQPVDMFPQTSNIETIVVLHKR